MPGSTFTSLHTLSVQHPGFLTHPKFWTSRHASIVNCVFQQVDTDYTTIFACTPNPDSDKASLAADAEKLAKRPAPAMKFFWVEKLLLHQGSPITYTNKPLSLSYNNHRVRHTAADVHIFCLKKELAVDQCDPFIGYYRYNVDQERRQMLCVPRAPRGLTNDPVKRLYDLRHRHLTPPDWRQDPYLFCLLLSLAQLYRRQRTDSRTKVILTRLLVTHMSDSTYAYIYESGIPHQLLECLDNPRRTLEDFSFPTVTWFKVPFEPYTTFADRIQFHLAGPSSEPISSSLMLLLQPRGKKRKSEELD